MKPSFLSARASRVALFSLLALGAYTEAQACPCGCVRVPVDNLLDRPAAATSPFTFDVRYDNVDQNRRNNDAHAHYASAEKRCLVRSGAQSDSGIQVQARDDG